uniref:Rho GTPase-activating protein 32 n=1 Tax=Xiphophorus maculatus TaxID=8083 RepID=A0A3B5Q9B8_XIPMA
QARSAEIPELRAEPLIRSSSSSTASMKVKNVKKLSFTKGHFPKLAECAHFHYENVDFGTIQLTLGDEQCEVTRNSYESKELVYLVHIYCQGRSWIVKRSYEDFRVLDKHLHLCIYDRRFSQLPELPRLDSLTDQSESVSQMLLAYLSRLSAIADNKINCGPALTWMEVDNKGNHLLVHEESSINVPAIAAAHVIKRYIAQASDELSFEVGDIVSVIDMPPKEDTTWWRGKHGFQVGFFPSECVELINDKVPQSMTNSVPKPVSKKHGKLITFLRSFMKSRPTKQKLKQRGILRERVFGCDLGEHLLNSGHDVPQVLKSCTEFIEKHGVVDGIYRLSGIASNIQKLRHEFDSEQIPDLTKDVYIQDIHCVGSLCKLYFRELPNPLLTYQLYEKFSEAVSAATDEERLIKIHDVIQQLPPPHYRTLEFLMRHLSRLAAFSYITNMHTKNLAIVWAPNLLRSKQIESACFSGTAAFMEVRIQSVVVEFILNHVDVLFSTKLSSLIREGHNSLSRPKSLLVSSPSTKLLSLEEAQARTQAQINSPVTEDSKYIEVGEGPAALQGKFHTVIEFPTERKRPPIKSKKSPVGSWRSFFNLGKSSSLSKRKLQRNPSEPSELKAMALPGGRGDTATLRSAKSEESLSSLHNVEGESKVYRPRRPRSSSDALSASFNGELLDSRQQCNSYDNLDATEDSDGDDGPICVPALISPPRSAGEDVDLSPPDIGMASLDFDPMSFQCSVPDTTFAFPLGDSSTGTEGSTLKRSPKSNGSDLITASFPGGVTSPLLSADRSMAEKAESKKLTTSYSYTDKPMQAVSPIKCGKATSLTPFAMLELFSPEIPDRNGAGQPISKQPLSPPPMPKESPPLMGKAADDNILLLSLNKAKTLSIFHPPLYKETRRGKKS